MGVGIVLEEVERSFCTYRQCYSGTDKETLGIEFLVDLESYVPFPQGVIECFVCLGSNSLLARYKVHHVAGRHTSREKRPESRLSGIFAALSTSTMNLFGTILPGGLAFLILEGGKTEAQTL